MDQLNGRPNMGRPPGNPGHRPPQWNPRPNPRPPRPPRPEPPRPPRPEPPRPPRPEPPRPPRPPRPEPPRPPRPIPIPVPVENVIVVNNAVITDVDITQQFSTITISYNALNPFNQVITQAVSLVITNETEIVNQFGQNIGAWGLRTGMIVNVRFSSRFTRSIPPQSTAYYIRIVRFS